MDDNIIDDFVIDDSMNESRSPLPPPIPDQYRQPTLPPLPKSELPVELETNDIVETEIDITDPEIDSSEQCDIPNQKLDSDLNAKLEAQATKITELMAAVNTLQATFNEKIAVSTHQNELFDKMYSELSAYKNDLYSKILKPFVLGTITLLDDINKFLDSELKNEEDATVFALRALRFLKGIPDDLIDLLESNGVEIYNDTSTETFNPRTQRAVKQLPTDSPELDNTIARRLRGGYHWNGATLRPEMVEIYKFRK